MKHPLAGILLLFFCQLPLLCAAQTDEVITIQGKIVDADSLSPIPYVHIRLKADRMGSASDMQGHFNVKTYAQDSLLFSSVGYEPFLLVPADSSEESLQNLVIRMKPKLYELKEIEVRAYGDISKYIRREYKQPEMKQTQPEPLFKRKEPEKKNAVGLATGMNGAALEGALTAFANLFNDKFQQEKKLKKLLEIEEAEKREQYLRDMMTEKFQALTAQASNLSAADLQRFTEQSMPPPQLMLNMNDYDLVVIILEDLEKFQPSDNGDDSVEKILKNGVFEGERIRPR